MTVYTPSPSLTLLSPSLSQYILLKTSFLNYPRRCSPLPTTGHDPGHLQTLRLIRPTKCPDCQQIKPWPRPQCQNKRVCRHLQSLRLTRPSRNVDRQHIKPWPRPQCRHKRARHSRLGADRGLAVTEKRWQGSPHAGCGGGLAAFPIIQTPSLPRLQQATHFTQPSVASLMAPRMDTKRLPCQELPPERSVATDEQRRPTTR